jgi:hypothetical protein
MKEIQPFLSNFTGWIRIWSPYSHSDNILDPDAMYYVCDNEKFAYFLIHFKTYYYGLGEKREDTDLDSKLIILGLI